MRKLTKLFLTSFFFTTVLMAAPRIAFASELDSMMNGFCVEVQMDPIATDSGLKKEDAKALVEGVLQKSGIKMLDKCPNAITVNILATKTVIQNTTLPEFYAFAVLFSVGEKAKIIGRKKPKEQVVTTYLQSATALLKKTELARLNEEAIKPLAEAFSAEFGKAAQ